jgi:hypothetical protein
VRYTVGVAAVVVVAGVVVVVVVFVVVGFGVGFAGTITD